MSGDAATAAAGLSSAEAARRLEQYGPNDPAPQEQHYHLTPPLMQFANPLVVIVLFASVLSAFIGEFVMRRSSSSCSAPQSTSCRRIALSKLQIGYAKGLRQRRQFCATAYLPKYRERRSYQVM